MIYKRQVIFSGLFFLTTYFFSLFSVDIQVEAVKHARVKLLVCMVGKKNKDLQVVAQQIARNLAFSRQFSVEVEYLTRLRKNQDVKTFFDRGFPLVLFLNQEKRSVYEWRLYDAECASMIAGKKYRKRGRDVREWAHHITDSAWPVLTGKAGFFSTKIAYCKEVRRPGKKPFKHIYVADYDGSNEKLLVSTPTVNVAPCWNRDSSNPLLFYSEHTNQNVRLVSVDMKGRRRVVSNFDGINMLPAFSPDGKQVVFCASRGGGTCQLYYFAKGVFKKLTFNSGNNIAPTFSQDGKTLFFCSDFETKGPQIYSYSFETEKQKRITNGGYCVSPSCSPGNNALAYAKMVRGVMQIFLYDLNTKKHRQVTFNAGNKEECSWSPCGNYLMFAVETSKESRLALLNLISEDCQFVTSRGAICCYPAWSCPYRNFWGA